MELELEQPELGELRGRDSASWLISTTGSDKNPDCKQWFIYNVQFKFYYIEPVTVVVEACDQMGISGISTYVI